MLFYIYIQYELAQHKNARGPDKLQALLLLIQVCNFILSQMRNIELPR